MNILKQLIKEFSAGQALICKALETKEEDLEKESDALDEVMQNEDEQTVDEFIKQQMAQNVDQICDFIDAFTPFREELDTKIQYGKLEYDSIEKQLGEVITAFGEDPKAISPKDFFQIFYSFAKDFSEAYKREV